MHRRGEPGNLVAPSRVLMMLNLPDIDLVAAALHDSWVAERRRDGVTTWRNQFDEDALVPYGELSDRSKDNDRLTVRAVYAAMNAATATQFRRWSSRLCERHGDVSTRIGGGIKSKEKAMNDAIQPSEAYESLSLGDHVEFNYHGSQPESGQRVTGEIVGFTPVIEWSGGRVPLDESGYATDVKKIAD